MEQSKERKILYFDCFSGISGDMILGAFINLGVPFPFLMKELRKLNMKSFSLKALSVKKNGIAATKVNVEITEREHERSLKEIEGIIGKSSLDQDIKEQSIRIFRKMIEAEAKVHGISTSKIHLHEMGAIDAIVDVVGSCIAIKKIGACEILSSPINVGKGFVHCDHGTFPVPAPATLEMLKNVPLYSYGDEGELTTPTGASIISSFAARFAPLQAMKVESIGYGAGSRHLKSHPNLLRIFLGTMEAHSDKEVTVIETTIDDMNPQIFGRLMELLFNGNALEVFFTNVMMKKQRPGILVTVICDTEDVDRIIGIIFQETTTIGVRFRKEERHELERKIVKVKTKFGEIRVKISLFEGKLSQASPEFDDCVKASQKFKVPLKDVQQEVIAEYRKER